MKKFKKYKKKFKDFEIATKKFVNLSLMGIESYIYTANKRNVNYYILHYYYYYKLKGV